MRYFKTRDIVLTAFFTAIGVILPIAFHSVPMFGRIYLPMHLAVIICGIVCGPWLGAICALLTVGLSTAITQMPPLYPTAVIMVFELITYAIVSGITVRVLIKKLKVIPSLYIALIVSMIVGRMVLGIGSVIFIGMLGNGYSLNAFLAAAFITALPGIIIQLIIIPWIIFFLQKNNFVNFNLTKADNK